MRHDTHLRELFAAGAATISTQTRQFVLRYRSARPAGWKHFRNYYGPLNKAFAALQPAKQAALATDVTGLLQEFNSRAIRRL